MAGNDGGQWLLLVVVTVARIREHKGMRVSVCELILGWETKWKLDV